MTTQIKTPEEIAEEISDGMRGHYTDLDSARYDAAFAAIEADRAQRAAIHQDYRDDQEMVKDGGGYVNVSWVVETENGKHWFESDMRLTNAQAVGMFQGIGEAAQ